MPDPADPATARGPRTLFGFDFGRRQVGVAIGNTLTGAARPLAIVRDEATARRFAAIGSLIDAWHPDAFVVGRPLHPDGAPHEVTAAAERFARQLAGRFGRPVILVDERYSTVEARSRAHSAGTRLDDDDAHAAAVILEQYLDGERDAQPLPVAAAAPSTEEVRR